MAESDGSREPLIERENHNIELDLTNRDPKKINQDMVKVDFEDVIAEPAGVHTMAKVWKCSYKCFSLSQRCCYRSLTVLAGIPLSLLWGLLFGFLTFCHIWFVVPCNKSCLFEFKCLCQPCTERVLDALGKMCKGLRVVFRKEA